MSDRPLYRFAIVPNIETQLKDLAALAEPEEWSYKNAQDPNPLPVLYNYIHYTFARLEEEKKVAVTQDDKRACFNTGLVTVHQEPIFATFVANNFFNGTTDMRKGGTSENGAGRAKVI